MKIKKTFLIALLLAEVFLATCAAHGDSTPDSSGMVATIVVDTMQAFNSITPTATPAQVCPSETDGMLLFTNEEEGYCLLYPEGYAVIVPLAGEVCFVPGDPPYMACHGASLLINVEDALGRTADQVADELVSQTEFEIKRSGLTVDNEAAVVLEGLPGQDSSRVVIFVHAGQLYNLTFIMPPKDDSNPDSVMENMFSRVTGSFVFLR